MSTRNRLRRAGRRGQRLAKALYRKGVKLGSALSGDRHAQYALLKYLKIPAVTVDAGGNRFFIRTADNYVGRHLFIYGVWERFETALIGHLLQPGATMIDVGANIGYYAVLASRRVGATGTVFAFEPGAENFALLENNLRLNDCSNVVAERLALADENGRGKLFLSVSNPGDHRLHPAASFGDAGYDGEPVRAAESVRLMRLDDYLAQRGAARVDVMKVDVQGAEMAVLRGAERTLRQNPGLFLLLEFWPYGLRQFGAQPGDLLAYLQEEMGFSVREIDPQRQELRPLDWEWVEARRGEADPADQKDLIFFRPHLLPLLERLSLPGDNGR